MSDRNGPRGQTRRTLVVLFVGVLITFAITRCMITRKGSAAEAPRVEPPTGLEPAT